MGFSAGNLKTASALLGVFNALIFFNSISEMSVTLPLGTKSISSVEKRA